MEDDRRRPLAGLTFLLSLFLVSCGSEEPETADSSAESDPAATEEETEQESVSQEDQQDLLLEYLGGTGHSTPAMPAAPPPVPQVEGDPAENLNYLVPDGWEALPATGLRAVNLKIVHNDEEAEFYAVPLAGTGGDELSNVNSWRAEAGMQPLTDPAEIAAVRREKSFEAGDFRIYELLPAELGTGVVVAVLPREKLTWFFKMRGPKAALVASLDEFELFLKSLRFDDGE